MNALSALLWMVLAWQAHGASIAVTSQCVDWDGKPVPCAAPFDVPPVQTPTDEMVCVSVQGITLKCTPRAYSCAEKSRFLLMDELGVWHCLALGQR